jgi:hypothetical protein
VEYLIEMRSKNERDKVQTQNLFFDTMLNHHLSQKLKLIRRDKFNHLINTSTLYSTTVIFGDARIITGNCERWVSYPNKTLLPKGFLCRMGSFLE